MKKCLTLLSTITPNLVSDQWMVAASGRVQGYKGSLYMVAVPPFCVERVFAENTSSGDDVMLAVSPFFVEHVFA